MPGRDRTDQAGVRAIVSDAKSIRLTTEHPEARATPGDAVVRPTKVLLTPADAAVARRVLSGAIEGPRAHVGVLGHRFVGVLKSVNLASDAPGTLASRKGWVGRRVIASPTIACGQCDMCRRGLSTHCRTRRVMGVHEREGCLSDTIALPAATLHLVPEGVEDEAAVFALDVASAAHAGNLVRVEGHAYVTVIGETALALITAQLLSKRNATVRLLSASPEAARLCERWGLKQRSPDEPGRRQDQDVVIDCSGSSTGLKLALQMVRPRGMIMLKNPLALAPFPAGTALGATPGAYVPGFDLTLAVVNEVHIVGSREGAIPDGLALLKEGAVDTATLISRRVRMSDAAEALKLEAASPASSWGVMVDMDAR